MGRDASSSSLIECVSYTDIHSGSDHDWESAEDPNLSRWHHRRSKARRWLHRHFMITADPKFLGSHCSKRALWHFTFPLFAFFNCMIHISSGSFRDSLWKAGGDVAFFVMSLLFTKLPSESLWSDVIIGTFCFAYSCFCFSFLNPVVSADISLAFLLPVTGVHFLAILGSGSLAALFQMLMSEGVKNIPALLFVLLAAFFAWYTNLQQAEVWSELQSQANLGKIMVEDACNGFCTIDPVNYEIKAANDQMRSLFGNLELVHKSLTGFMASDDTRFVEVLCESVIAGSDIGPNVRPFQATCLVPLEGKSDKVALDLKFIPVAWSQHSLSVSLCIQVIREMKVSGSALLSGSSIFDLSSSSQQKHFSHGRRQEDAQVQTDYRLDHLSLLTLNQQVAQVQTDAAPTAVGKPPRAPVSQTEEDSESGSSGSSSYARDSGGRIISWSKRQRSGRGVRRQARQRSPRSNQGSEEEYQNNVLLQAYLPTDVDTCRSAIEGLMKYWNLPRLANMCCPKHSALEACKFVLKTSKTRPCDPLWSPYNAWQCWSCKGMNEQDVLQCGLCLASIDAPEKAAANTNTASL